MILKFRARIENHDGTKEMFYQDDQYLTSFLRRVTSKMYFQRTDEGVHESYLDQTVDQVLDLCTGSLDKDGKEIYNGDILDTPDGRLVVSFELGCFVMKNEGWPKIFHGYNTKLCSIVGNTHETPALLANNANQKED